MKAMKLTGIGQMELMEVPAPAIAHPDDMLIKVSQVGVCGSDIHYYATGRIGSQVVEFPFAVGHETAGVVVETGSGVKNLQPGDRIAIDPAVSCGDCDQCLAGRSHTCRKLKFLGCPGQLEGSLMEYIVMPEKCCYKIPGHMTMDEAVISEPLAIGVYAVNQAGSLEGKRVGIFGFGPIGMSVMLAGKAKGASDFIATDLIEARKDFARKLGAAWVGDGHDPGLAAKIYKETPLALDVIFECCGKQEAVDIALETLKPGGKLMLIGIPEFDRWSFSADLMRRKEIAIVNVRRQNECVAETLELMASGKVNARQMVTHRFPFEKTKEAFDMVKEYRDGVMKAMIEFD